MSITRNDIDYIARLARLEVSEADSPVYAEKLDKIIGFIAALEAADTEGLLPMAHPLDMAQRLRPDEVTAPADKAQRDHYQQNATEKADGLYIVPRVVE